MLNQLRRSAWEKEQPYNKNNYSALTSPMHLYNLWCRSSQNRLHLHDLIAMQVAELWDFFFFWIMVCFFWINPIWLYEQIFYHVLCSFAYFRQYLPDLKEKKLVKFLIPLCKNFENLAQPLMRIIILKKKFYFYFSSPNEDVLGVFDEIWKPNRYPAY